MGHGHAYGIVQTSVGKHVPYIVVPNLVNVPVCFSCTYPELLAKLSCFDNKTVDIVSPERV